MNNTIAVAIALAIGASAVTPGPAFAKQRDYKEGGSSRILKPFTGTWTSTPGVCKAKMDEPGGASITTIKGDEITNWWSYSWKGEKDQAYGSCGVVRGQVRSGGSIVVDLECDHPGHSQKGVMVTKLDANRIKYRSEILHRCR